MSKTFALSLSDCLRFFPGTLCPSAQFKILSRGRSYNMVNVQVPLIAHQLINALPALNTKDRIFFEDVTSEPRFASESQQSPHRSVVCLPIVSNRNQTFGAIYLASKYAFSANIVTILTLLCEQASIGIANALLFRSVQAGTKENLKMIAAQRDALEVARRSREDALKATKVSQDIQNSLHWS